jgi:thiamine-phosphate pyrophosphorylase
LTGPDPSGPPDRWVLEHRRLYLCTPDRSDLVDFVGACIEGGVDVVQLRDKSLPDEAVLERATGLQPVCREAGVPFILNDRPDLAASAGADGVHVGQDDAHPAAARQTTGPDALVGLSTHSSTDLGRAVGDATTAAAIDYVSAGPVVPTPTKPGRPGTGLGYVADAVRGSPWPVWVTGGVSPSSVPELVAAGARHFVVVRWLTGASNPGAAARELRDAIDEAIGAIDGEADDEHTPSAGHPSGRSGR